MNLNELEMDLLNLVMIIILLKCAKEQSVPFLYLRSEGGTGVKKDIELSNKL